MIQILMFALLVSVSFANSKFEVQTWSGRTSIEPTDQILLEGANGGKLAKAIPSATMPSIFYLRFKEDQNVHGFYKGKPKGDFFSKTYAFKIKSGELKKWANTKFYRKVRQNAFRDEDEVYFDQNFIYSAYVPTLYYKQKGKWMPIQAETKKPSALLIQTSPSGAELFVGNELLGSSPFKTHGIGEGVMALTVKAQGYLSKVFLVEIEPGQQLDINLQLIPLIAQNKDLEVSLEQYTIPKSDNIQPLSDVLDVVNSEFSGIMIQLDSITTQFNKSYGEKPDLAPMDIDEWQSIPYLNYKDEYIKIRKEAFESQVALFKDRIAYLTATRIRLKNKMLYIENLLDSIKIKPSAFKWAIIDSVEGQYGFKFKVQSEDGKHDFVYKATAILTKTQANELRADLDRGDSTEVEFTLKFQNKLARIPSQNKILERFYRYRHYRISKDSSQFAFAGTFVLPPYIASNQEVINWMNADKILAQKRLAYGQKQQKLLAQKRLELEATQYQELLAKLRGDVVELSEAKFSYKGKTVTMSPFAYNTSEISQQHYKLITNKNPSNFKNIKKPVNNVSWEDANKFCKTVGGKLPTEAQWEYAMRAGTNTYYFWGDRGKDASPYAIYSANSFEEGPYSPAYGPQEIGSKRANPWGFYDGAGNLREWVSDWDGLVSFEFYIDEKDPKGLSNIFGFHYEHIIKGGSWRQDSKMMEHAKSDYEDARFWADDLGFRCVYPSNQTRKPKDILTIINKHKKKVKGEKLAETEAKEVIESPLAKDTTAAKDSSATKDISAVKDRISLPAKTPVANKVTKPIQSTPTVTGIVPIVQVKPVTAEPLPTLVKPTSNSKQVDEVKPTTPAPADVGVPVLKPAGEEVKPVVAPNVIPTIVPTEALAPKALPIEVKPSVVLPTN